MLKRAVALVSLAGMLSAHAALVLHVSPRGADTNPGTAAQPFATLERARDEIRSLKTKGLPDGGILVQIEPGTYELRAPFALTQEDAGTAASPIVYRAARRGTVTISGGVALTNWRSVDDPAALKLVDPAAKGKLVCAELGPDLLASIPGFANGGCGYKGTPEYPVALYQDNARLPISRWPNEDFAQMGECLGESVNWGRGIKFTEGKFRFGDARLARWVNEPDLWFDGLWYWAWADQKMACKAIDPKAKTIALANPESHAFGFRKGQEFFAFNAIGEIDRPGEWAVDRKARRLYLWPAADPKTHPVTVSLRSNLVTAEDVQQVSFEDLIFENSVATAIDLKNSTAVTVSGSVLRHTGSWGVVINGGSECTVIGCDLYDLGEGGVKASGGIRQTLTPGNHLIENNHIHHFGRFVNTYRPGAAVYGVGNKIRHNLIHHAQHQAMYFRGNDHLIEYNIVHDVCLHTSDAGALYACTRDWSQRGTVIRNNFIFSTGKGVDACGSHGIYMDDSTSGTTIEQNIVVDVGVGITSCGLDSRVENNICVNTRKPSVQLSSRGIDSFAKKNAAKGRESSLFRKFLRDEKLFETDLWRKRYPNLLAIMDMDPIEAHDSHFNIIRDNVNVGGVPLAVRNAKKVMRTCDIKDNLNFYEDPGFVDLAHYDLRLRKDALLLRKLPGFKAPEFEKMGLYADARRASPAVKFGKGASPMPEIQPRIPRPELKPRYILEELAGKPFAADGVADPKEWPKTRKPELECSNKIYKLPSKFPCTARIGFDGTAIRFLVTVHVDPAKPISNEGKWGQRDGFELAFSDTGEDAPVFLLHGYPDGTFELTSSDAAAAKRIDALTKATAYGAKAEKDQWTAELAIPVAELGIRPETFRQVRFNMNLHRTCADTWTCWWTPENGITDLLSSGLLILPRVLPETEEMVQRRAAAKPLFAAESKGDLKWQQLKNWAQTADPDCLGPAGQPADAPRVSFGNYAGWAVVRHTVPVTAEQLASPFCALFLPCVDEEGDVYLDGKLAVSHTAKATGIAPGLLWRQPFLVDLKKAVAKAGDVQVAVHLRGNMGTGGLRKGAFLVWGKTVFPAEQIYDFLSENSKLGWRDRVPPFWQDLERVHLPPLPSVPDEATFGTHIQRTMDLLASSSPEKRNRVRILFYGQSIVQGMHCREMINVLRTRFPWAIIDFENRAIGGFTAPSLVRTAVHDLYPRDADLVVFHVYGGEHDGTLEEIIKGMRERNSSDILVYTHHYTWTTDPERLLSGLKSRDDSAKYWLELAKTYKLEVAPVRRDWPLFFRTHDWGINEVMGDTVHSNVHHNPTGHTLLAKLVLRNFRHHPGHPVDFPDAITNVDLAGKTVTTTGAWQRDGGLRTAAKDARLTLSFTGDRVDVLPLPTDKPGTARILIDGKSPAELPELYYCTRPSTGPYIWMPAIKRITLGDGVLPRLETWTLTPENVDIAKKAFQFRLDGSITGPDGTGDKSSDFVSTSGRIKLNKRDFHIIWPCTYRKKDQLPDGYKVTWEVKPLFVDPWRPAVHADPAYQRPVTLVKGLGNGPHTLEIIANGDGEIPIQALIVRQPSMK
jgi:hypothetical protein